MADGFAFEVVADASKANKAVDGVVAGLAKIPPGAQRAGQAINSAMSEAQRLTSAHEASIRGVAQRQEQLNAALQREADVLNRIKGPMRENVADMQALQALYRSNQINAHEYATEVNRLRDSLLAQHQAASKRPAGGGGFDVGSALGGLPGGSIVAGAVGGGAAGAAQAGIQAAAGAVHTVIEMSDAYTNMNNRLRTLTGTTEGAHEAFEKVLDVANRTRSDLGTTTEAFVRVSNATKQMGLSQDQALKFTERLSEITQLSGASASESAGAMMQLSQALASGTLRGDEFNSINEQMHPLITLIAQNLGVAEGQLRKMAETGQLTSQIIYDSVNKAGGALDRQFAQTVPTISQQFVVLKNEVTAAVGKFADDAGLAKTFADTLSLVKDAAKEAGVQLKLLGDVMDVAGIKLSDITGGNSAGLKAIVDTFKHAGDFSFDPFGKGKLNNYIDGQEVINRTIAEGTGHLNEYSQAMVQQTLQTKLGEGAANAFHEAIQRATGVTDEWRISTDGVSQRIEHLVQVPGQQLIAWLTDTSGQIDRMVRATDPWFEAHEREVNVLGRVTQQIQLAIPSWDQLTKKIEHNAAASKKASDEYAKLGRALLGGETPSARAIHAGEVDRAAFRAGVEADAQAEIDAENRAVADAYAAADAKIKADEEWRKAVLKSTDEAQEARLKAEKDLADAAEKTKEAWAGAAGSIAADLINAFEAGNVSADKLLRKAAILALQLAATSAGGTGGAFLSALAGGLGGGRNGFDYTVGSSGLQLPGFAGGGSITRQPGGPEPMLAMWWMQPNETLSIRTEEQQRRAQQGAGSGGSVTITPVIKVLQPPDRRDIVDDSRQGLTTLVRLQRQTGRSRR